MKLTQTAFLLPKFEFTIRDHVLHVKRSTLTASSSFEIPFIEIDPLPSEQKNLALGWYVVGGLLLALTLTFIGCAIVEKIPDSQMGLWFGALIAGVPGIICLVEARKRTFSFIIFHNARNGVAWIHIRHKSPSELHVQEFTDILKEKIESERDESRRERP